jgi:hypothetical protein
MFQVKKDECVYYIVQYSQKGTVKDGQSRHVWVKVNYSSGSENKFTKIIEYYHSHRQLYRIIIL